MNKSLLLAALLAVLPWVTLGQGAGKEASTQVTTNKVEAPKTAPVAVDAQATTKKETQEKKAAVAPEKPASEVLGKKVTYAGYLVDFTQAEKKRPLFSARTPIDPQKDFDNLWIDPRNDRPSGVILFSIKF